MFDTCCVVNQYCERPANLEYDPEEKYRDLPECFMCGQDVCRKCSSKRKYMHYGVVLLCDNCQEQYDDTPWHVVFRYALMSGYDHKAAAKYANEYPTPSKAKKDREEAHRKHSEMLAERARLERIAQARINSNQACRACGGTGRRKATNEVRHRET